MSSDIFTTSTHAKCILAGEHAVLRDHPALAFPLLSKTLRFDYDPTPTTLTVVLKGLAQEYEESVFWEILSISLKKIGRDLTHLTGQFSLESHIPLGGGMGASAALCVSIAHWFVWMGWLARSGVFEFARQLENPFHGESSGIDIAASLADHPILFTRQHTPHPLNLRWQPHLYLSYCGTKGQTQACVQRVQDLWKTDPTLAEQLDEQMSSSVHLACNALEENSPHSIEKLKQSITLAQDCFQQWGLITTELQQHISDLQKLGALAVKPTGSGGGGYVLSLWRDKPVV